MRYLKKYKLSEAHLPGYNFRMESAKLYDILLPDVEDILLELKDNGIKIDVNKYIDGVTFEIQVTIEKVESGEQKQLVEDSIFRLEQFLDEYGIHFSKIDLIQKISPLHQFGDWFEILDIDKLKEIKRFKGVISIDVMFSKQNYNY